MERGHGIHDLFLIFMDIVKLCYEAILLPAI